MDRVTAVRLVCKLRALTEDRGATPAEARLAAEKAARLEVRFGLKAHESRVRAAPKRERVWTAPSSGFPVWSFDIRTGRASENVKVHRYNSARDWKIEIPL